MAEAPGHFRLDKARDNTQAWRWRWDLTESMGRIIASAADFPDREAAERSIRWVKDNAANCEVLEPPDRSIGIA